MALREQSIFITGPVGQLEAVVSYPENTSQKKVGIVCHPHPLYGGTMNNKVVTTVAKVFTNLGMPAVRFNYRGVGQSVGEYANGIGETEDALAVFAWAQKEFPETEIYLAGFSFGAYVAARVAMQQKVARLILIAPAVQNFNFIDLGHVQEGWILVQGGQDEVVPADEVLAWAKSQPNSPQLIYLPEAGHFFHGRLIELRAQLESALM